MNAIYKIFTFAAAAALLMSSCRGSEPEMLAEAEGTLSFESFSLDRDDEVNVATKAVSQADGAYTIIVSDADGIPVLNTTYAEVKAAGNKVSLKAGHYTLEAKSVAADIEAAAFEKPVYGARTSFDITAGKTTALGSLTCTLLQCKVTVSYDAGFLESVSGNGTATVEVTEGYPLAYELLYAGGKASYEQRAGYFDVNNGNNTTMTVTYKGIIEGKSQKMTAVFRDVAAKQWRQIKFIKKIDEQGNVTFTLEIDGYVADEELGVKVSVENESVIGTDPKAPTGDGGIKLELAEDCTMYSDLMNIVVPASGKMDLRLVATIPDGIKKFVVHIASTNESFIKSVEMAGGVDLDLINPSEDAAIVFQIVPFPHGQELLGQKRIAFDLSAAQDAILAFPGTHTFTMTITDSNNCKKQQDVAMIVK